MHWHKAALASIIFVCLALLGLAAIKSGSYFSDYRRDVEYNKEYCASKEHAEERHNSKECQSVLYRTFDDPLALLTAGLTVATIALFVVTFGLYVAAARQALDAKVAGAAARDSAEAAKLSAAAAIGADAAILIQTGIVMERRHFGDLAAELQTPSFVVRARNYGRTAAFVRKSSATVYAGGVLPAEPDYQHVLTWGPENVVQPDNMFSLDKARPADFELAFNAAEAIAAGRAFLWVYGFVIYDDVFRREHVHRFCKRMVLPLKPGESEAWVSDGPEAYQRST